MGKYKIFSIFQATYYLVQCDVEESRVWNLSYSATGGIDIRAKLGEISLASYHDGRNWLTPGFNEYSWTAWRPLLGMGEPALQNIWGHSMSQMAGTHENIMITGSHWGRYDPEILINEDYLKMSLSLFIENSDTLGF